MSKKLAEGIDGLVLDVKTGNGAFLPHLDDSRDLARTMCDIGHGLGKQVVALLTRMDQPLGMAVGNAVEVEESVNCLRGEGPADLVRPLRRTRRRDGRDGRTRTEPGTGPHALPADHRPTARHSTASDRSSNAQGGDPRVVDQPGLLPQPKAREAIYATRSGFVTQIAARPIGHAVMLLGAGRHRVDSVIDPAVGLWLNKKVGDHVERGEPLAWLLHQGATEAVAQARQIIEQAFEIGDEPATQPNL